MLCLLLSATALWALAASKSVPINKRSSRCFGDLGCFTTDPPFFSLHRPLNFLPLSPATINTRFYLYTRSHPGQQLLKNSDASSLSSSDFQASRPTKMVVHGFLENGMVNWMLHMKDELLKHGDYNVINIDWGGGSLPPYTQATANTRVVGAEIAKLIKLLQQTAGAKPETFHIIGHSLGAHVAGYAGERIQYVGRITGLDPADPYFQYTDKVVRLDPTDALFVDVMHTDGESILKLGYGMIQPCGHVDYFPNGGERQPGCDKGPITQIQLEGIYEGVKQFVACNHLRAYDYFTESINSACPFEGYHCTSYQDFEQGKCLRCQGLDCGYMGFHADRVKPQSGQTLVKYFLKTASGKPFCSYHYEVKVTFAKTPQSSSERGKLYVTLVGQSGQSGEVQLGDDNIDVTPGQTYTYVVISPKPLGALQRVSFRWDHSSSLLNPFKWNLLGLRHPTLFIDKLELFSGEDKHGYSFCGHQAGVETDKTLLIQSQC